MGCRLPQRITAHCLILYGDSRHFQKLLMPLQFPLRFLRLRRHQFPLVHPGNQLQGDKGILFYPSGGQLFPNDILLHSQKLRRPAHRLLFVLQLPRDDSHGRHHAAACQNFPVPVHNAPSVRFGDGDPHLIRRAKSREDQGIRPDQPPASSDFQKESLIFKTDVTGKGIEGNLKCYKPLFLVVPGDFRCHVLRLDSLINGGIPADKGFFGNIAGAFRIHHGVHLLISLLGNQFHVLLQQFRRVLFLFFGSQAVNARPASVSRFHIRIACEYFADSRQKVPAFISSRPHGKAQSIYNHADGQHFQQNNCLQYGFRPSAFLSVPVGSVPVNSVPAGSVPVNSVPASSVPVNSVPGNSVPVASIPANSTPGFCTHDYSPSSYVLS